MKSVNIALIGAGPAGRLHAIAYRNVPMTFGPDPAVPRLTLIVSEAKPRESEFECAWQSDWRAAISDKNIEVVAIAAPVKDRAKIALAAVTAGKHLYCDQPIAASAIDTEKISGAATKAGVIAAASFPYLANPAQTLARRLIADGKIGTVTKVRIVSDTDGSNESDLIGDVEAGALQTLGGEAIAFAHSLIGNITAVCGSQKRLANGAGTEDACQFLARFDNGALGVIGCNRRCAGKKTGLFYEIQGTKGALRFSQERMNEIDFYDFGDESWQRGYQTLYSGPIDTFYAGFHPIPGLALGHVDQKTIEVRKLIEAIVKGTPPPTDMYFAVQTARTIDAVRESDRSSQWVVVRGH